MRWRAVVSAKPPDARTRMARASSFGAAASNPVIAGGAPLQWRVFVEPREVRATGVVRPQQRPRSRRLGGRLAVEALAVGGHVAQELGHRELGAVLLGELIALGDEGLDADLVDQADGAAGLRREAKPHDRADIAVLRRGQHIGLEAARGVDSLHVEQAL